MITRSKFFKGGSSDRSSLKLLGANLGILLLINLPIQIIPWVLIMCVVTAMKCKRLLILIFAACTLLEQQHIGFGILGLLGSRCAVICNQDGIHIWYIYQTIAYCVQCVIHWCGQDRCDTFQLSGSCPKLHHIFGLG